MMRLPLQRGSAAATTIGAAFALWSCQEDPENAGGSDTADAPTSPKVPVGELPPHLQNLDLSKELSWGALG